MPATRCAYLVVHYRFTLIHKAKRNRKLLTIFESCCRVSRADGAGSPGGGQRGDPLYSVDDLSWFPPSPDCSFSRDHCDRVDSSQSTTFSLPLTQPTPDGCANYKQLPLFTIKKTFIHYFPIHSLIELNSKMDKLKLNC